MGRGYRGTIEKLQAGETIQFRPVGNSMTPRVSSGALVTVEPIKDHTTVERGDVVLCKVRGKVYLHLVTAIKDGQFQIGNNHGHINGWTSSAKVYGKLIKVEE